VDVGVLANDLDGVAVLVKVTDGVTLFVGVLVIVGVGQVAILISLYFNFSIFIAIAGLPLVQE
jgi:hypothetical protein